MIYIPLDQCKKGGLYRIESRNMSLGVFNGSDGFIGVDYYFGGDRSLAVEHHWDTGPPHGTVKPEDFLEMCPLDFHGVDDHGFDEEPLIEWIEERLRSNGSI